MGTRNRWRLQITASSRCEAMAGSSGWQAFAVTLFIATNARCAQGVISVLAPLEHLTVEIAYLSVQPGGRSHQNRYLAHPPRAMSRCLRGEGEQSMRANGPQTRMFSNKPILA